MSNTISVILNYLDSLRQLIMIVIRFGILIRYLDQMLCMLTTFKQTIPLNIIAAIVSKWIKTWKDLPCPSLLWSHELLTHGPALSASYLKLHNFQVINQIFFCFVFSCRYFQVKSSERVHWSCCCGWIFIACVCHCYILQRI